MPPMKLHGGAVLRDHFLQRRRLDSLKASWSFRRAIRVMHGHVLPIGKLELGQSTTRIKSKGFVQIKKIGLVCQVTSPDGLCMHRKSPRRLPEISGARP